jgi:hypothetical protein
MVFVEADTINYKGKIVAMVRVIHESYTNRAWVVMAFLARSSA